MMFEQYSFATLWITSLMLTFGWGWLAARYWRLRSQFNVLEWRFEKMMQELAKGSTEKVS